VQSRRKKGRRLLLKLALLLFGGCVALTLGEAAVRIISPQPPSWLDVYRRHPTLDVFALQPNVDRFVDTGETRWTVYTDGSGFRISKGQNDDADLPVALWLGDSMTFAHGVDHRDSFVGLLNANEGRRYRFVNAAVPAYGPVQYRQTLEYLLEQGLNPRVVLVATFMGNDFYDCVWNKDRPVVDGIIGKRRTLKGFIKRRSHLYRLVSKVYHQLALGEAGARKSEEELSLEESWKHGILKQGLERYRIEFNRIADICRERSISLLVVLIPPRSTVKAIINESRPLGWLRCAWTTSWPSSRHQRS